MQFTGLKFSSYKGVNMEGRIITWKELINHLQSLPEDKLNDCVTIYLEDKDEFVPISLNDIVQANEKETDVLDEGCIYIKAGTVI